MVISGHTGQRSRQSRASTRWAWPGLVPIQHGPSSSSTWLRRHRIEVTNHSSRFVAPLSGAATDCGLPSETVTMSASSPVTSTVWLPRCTSRLPLARPSDTLSR